MSPGLVDWPKSPMIFSQTSEESTFRAAIFKENALYSAIFDDELGINEGLLVENAVAQALKSSKEKLYFYSRANREDRSERMEVDFLTLKDNRICPIEAKSGDWRHHRSLDKFRSKFSQSIG